MYSKYHPSELPKAWWEPGYPTKAKDTADTKKEITVENVLACVSEHDKVVRGEVLSDLGYSIFDDNARSLLKKALEAWEFEECIYFERSTWRIPEEYRQVKP